MVDGISGQANGCTVRKLDHVFILPSLPHSLSFSLSFCVYMGEQRNVSFLLETEGGEIGGGREGGREVGGLEGGGRTRDTVGERGEEESETREKGRTGNIEGRGEESQMIHQKCDR